MSLILPGNVASALPTGFNVDNSCRFNDGDSAYIYRDLGTSTAGSGKKFTFSAWVKKSNDKSGGHYLLDTAATSVGSENAIAFDGDQKFNINTLPIRFGIDFAVVFVYLFSFLLLISSILVYYLYDSYDLFYLITILLFIHFPLFFSIYNLSKNKTSIYCIYLSKVLKLLTIFGVIVIYLTNI